ncbi:MAG: DUF1990 domain-containing protein [Candidatus Obscuribacterales bacterium]|nr:DUF1990 domain-containing protein [Candidatus Obscuribacterales bacterium]
MFSIGRPSSEQVERYLSCTEGVSFNYPEQGMTAWADPPEGYVIDHNRVLMGSGRSTFDKAVAVLRRWEQFNVGWVGVANPGLPLEKDAVNAVIASLPLLSVTCACRIVYTINSNEASAASFGFAYGTLPGHPECGEERFLIEWKTDDDSVWYDIYALSKAGLFLVSATYPITRMLQRRFAKDSMAAMVRAVNA